MQNAQALRKTAWPLLTKLNMLSPCDSAVLLLGTYANELTYLHENLHTNISSNFIPNY